MNLRQKRITSAIALLLVFSTTQVYVSVSFAGPQPLPALNVTAPTVPQQPATGVLTTQGNKPITLNGASAISGATVVSGASIETPIEVGGTVNLGNLGSLQIDPNTKLTLEFQNGSVKVMVLQGCVHLRTRKGTTGEIDTSKGVSGTADGSRDAQLDVCDPSIATAPAAAAGPGGLSPTAGVLIGAAGMGAGVLIPLLTGGTNPSPGAPL
jgi:hypothetical protein